jgi:hypothetical protein
LDFPLKQLVKIVKVRTLWYYILFVLVGVNHISKWYPFIGWRPY